MHKNVIETLVEYAKEEVQKKYGKRITYAKDCLALSKEIAFETKRQLSVTTLKRFFGIIDSPFNPSKFTLDTLTTYLGFNDWQEFINTFENEEHQFSPESSWKQLAKRVELISSYSLRTMSAYRQQHSSPIPLQQKLYKKIDTFLNRSEPATAFIAPENYDLTSLITQFVAKQNERDNIVDQEDIILLLDGHIFLNLLTSNSNISRIYNLLEFDPANSFSNYFRQNPQEVKGRFIIMIDGINHITNKPELLHQLVENLNKIIAFYENIPWFKIIITCPPGTWKLFRYHLKKWPYIQSLWYDVSIKGDDMNPINIPPLSLPEIDCALQSADYPLTLENIRNNDPELIDLIQYPNFLNLLLSNKEINHAYPGIDLLYHYLHSIVLADSMAKAKIDLIHQFIQLSHEGKSIKPVNKQQLSMNSDNNIAYNELIASGCWLEYTKKGPYLEVHTCVKFAHPVLWEFILANHWLQNNAFNIDLVKTIIHEYKNNPERQAGLLKYIIKIAFKEERTDVLKDLLLLLSNNETSVLAKPVHQEMVTLTDRELRKNATNHLLAELLSLNSLVTKNKN